MAEINVMTLDGVPIAVADDFERLSERQADFDAERQKHLKIWPDVEVLT